MSKLHTDIPDEVIEANMISEDDVWQMFFDGAPRTGPTGKIIAGVGLDLSRQRITLFLVLFH